MIETLSGTPPDSPIDRNRRNAPRRSIEARTDTFAGGWIGISPSPRQSPISGSNSFIVGLPWRRTPGRRERAAPSRSRPGHVDRDDRVEEQAEDEQPAGAPRVDERRADEPERPADV